MQDGHLRIQSGPGGSDSGKDGKLIKSLELNEPTGKHGEIPISADVRELIAAAAECLANFRQIEKLPPEPLENDVILLTKLVTNGLGITDLVTEKEALKDLGYTPTMSPEALSFYVRAQILLLRAKMLLMGITDDSQLQNVETFATEFSLEAKEVVELNRTGQLVIHIRRGIDATLGFVK